MTGLIEYILSLAEVLHSNNNNVCNLSNIIISSISCSVDWLTSPSCYCIVIASAESLKLFWLSLAKCEEIHISASCRMEKHPPIGILEKKEFSVL
eukprot:3049577-Ditylum_brightwellii.AAC.1